MLIHHFFMLPCSNVFFSVTAMARSVARDPLVSTSSSNSLRGDDLQARVRRRWGLNTVKHSWVKRL